MASPSAVRAADGAVRETMRSLFQPFRPERWLALGFAAVLDQCTQLANSGAELVVRGTVESTPQAVIKEAGQWLGSHVLMAVAMAAGVLAVAVAVGALALWITCRGRFIYIDDVATGRADIRRPWREHAARAGSHFVWSLGLTLGSFLAALTLVLPMVWAGMALARSGPRAGPIVVLAVAALLLIALAFASALALVAMRDFVAPLQWYADVPCGAAIRLFLPLLRANPGVFAVFVLLKIVFVVVAVVATLLICCLTCCFAAVPYVQQVLLQPILYFERRWSLELLAQLGYGPPGAVTSLPPPDLPAEPEAGPPPAPPDALPSF